MKPMQKEKKHFYPNPLASLNRLSISLLKPNGTLLNESEDDYKIMHIDYDSTNPQYYRVTTTAYFDKNEFYEGDSVIFKNYSLSGTSVPSREVLVNEFVNRPEGHEVMKLGTPNANGFYNTFYIKAIGAFDKSAGQYVMDSAAITCLADYNNNEGNPVVQGDILNNSLQNSIGMSLDVLVGEFK
jgi:hypothetical protein